jgi:hypothetical protein
VSRWSLRFGDAEQPQTPKLDARGPLLRGLRLALHLLLRAPDAAPVFVFSDGHAAFDTDPDTLPWRLSFAGEELLEDRHSS